MIDMKNTILLTVFLSFCNILFSQYCTRPTTNIAITPSGLTQYTPAYSSGHRAFNFSVQAGCTYEFSTCGLSSNDTYLRLYSQSNGGVILAENDDYCSTQSTITWTSTVTGTVSILLSRYYCNKLTSNTSMSYRIVGCSVPNCTSPITPIDLSTNNQINSILEWNSISNASSYDVYFGTNSSPPFVTNTTGTIYVPTLNYNTTYYWKIVPKNGFGDATGCHTWSFSTGGPGCLNAQYGQYPSSTYNPTCNNTSEIITSAGYASEYSVVNLISGVSYTFSSSIGTDFITISDANGLNVLEWGTGTVTWISPNDGDYRFYTHTNNICGSSTTIRTRTIQCSTPPPPPNDLISGSISINTCGDTISGNTRFATNGDGPNCSPPQSPPENWTAPGVWYNFVGTGNNITISLCNSSYDTKIFVYTGSVNNLNCYVQNDDYCGLQSQITFSTTLDSTYYVLVTGYGSGRGFFNMIVTSAPSPPIITLQPIDKSICQGQSDILYVSTIGSNQPFSYQWYVYNNPIIGETSNTIVVSSQGNYHIEITNGCGLTTISNLAAVTINPNPNVSNKVIVNTSPNDSIGSIDISVSSGTSPYTYLWSNGYTTEDINNLSSGSYILTITDNNGCQKYDTTIISDLVCPTQLNAISGPQVLCDSFSVEYSINSLSGVNVYNWYLPQGMSIQLGIGTRTIIVSIDYSFVDGWIIVNGQTNCGVTESDSLWVSLSPNLPEFILADSCGYPDITQRYSVVSDGSTYIWQQPFGTVIISGQYTSDVDIKFSQSFTGGYVEVYSENSCGVSPSTQIYVDFPPLAPSMIRGSQNVCNSQIQMFWVDSVDRADYYIWNVPSGATIIGSNTNDTIFVQFNNFISGNITVMSANSCGSSPIRSLNITAATLANPTAIFGTTNVCNYIGGSTVNYSTPSVNGVTNYIWTAPLGSTIVSGQGTTSIMIQYHSGFNGGSLGLRHSNGCAVSSQRSLNIISSQSTNVGNVSGPTDVCNYTNGSSATYTIPTVSGASSYNWTAPQGSIITNNGNNTVQIAFPNGFTSGRIEVSVVFNCGPNANRFLNVSALPQFADIIGQLCVSEGQTFNYTLNGGFGATTYNWSIDGATIVSGQGTSNVSINFPINFDNATLVVTPSSHCGVANSDTIIISGAPIIPLAIYGPSQICAGDTVSYYIDNYNDVNYLIWNFPSGITPLNSNTSDTLMVVVNSSFAGGNMSVMSVNDCGSSPMRYKSLSNCISPRIVDNQDLSTVTTEVEFDFSIYPNPSSDYIEVVINTDKEYYFQITNSLGNTLVESRLVGKIDITDLSSGLYYIKVISNVGDMKNKRFTKQ